MERLLAGKESGYEFELQQIVSCVEAGYKLGWFPISTIYAGEVIWPLHHIVNFVRVAWQTRMRLRKRFGQHERLTRITMKSGR